MTKTNQTSYFVEIIPTGYYFFGGERTFQTVEKDKYGDLITNYFAESNNLPQQTAVLGMLRYTLLALYDKLMDIQSEKDITVGDCNFDFKYDEPYGLIDSISPVVLFIKSTKSILTPAGFDCQKYPDQKDKDILNDVAFKYMPAPMPAYVKGLIKTAPIIDGFEYKEDINQLWVDNTGNKYLEKDIFKSITKVGVDKVKPDDAFYKQTLTGLKKGFSFGVWVKFTNDLDASKLHNIGVSFGADQGFFKLTFRTDVENVLVKPEADQPKGGKIVFISDAWIDEKVFENIEFGITRFTDFRFINNNKKSYYTLHDKSKSNRYLLLERGSVLYPKPSFNHRSLFNSSFYRIGYNYFKII
jgi:CRISPR-associated protein Cmr3